MLATIKKQKELLKQGRLALLSGKLSLVEAIIKQLDELAPTTLHGYLLKAKYFLKTEDFDSLHSMLSEAITQFEYNAELNYFLAISYNKKNETKNSYHYAMKAFFLDNSMSPKVNELTEELKKQTPNLNDLDKKIFTETVGYQKAFPIDENGKCIFGEKISGSNFYVGIYDKSREERSPTGLKSLPSEDQRILLACEIMPGEETSNKEVSITEDSVIAIMPLIATQTLHFTIKNKTTESNYSTSTFTENRFHYIPFKQEEHVTITSNHNFIVSNQIKMAGNNKKPKLILSIFIDGLSQYFIDNNGGLEEMMPNTHHFFAKGIQFTQCFSSGEWTYVSLASMFSGLYTHHHRVFNPSMDSQNLKKTVLFPEYLQKQGYFCTKIDGDWRSVPSSGYIKGMDRIIYQPSLYNMHTESVISETLEHLDAFKEKNNFLWICLPDLHDIADEFETSLSHQLKTPLQFRSLTKTTESSVKKKKDLGKNHRYYQQVKYIDRKLKILYQFIEDNYDNDEIIVSLVSDHGQSYLVDSDFFMDDGRTRVPLYFRGRGVPMGKVDPSPMQQLDVFPCLLHLADIPITKHHDGNIPEVFGGKNREFTFSESVFPGQPYYAYINDKEHKFFLTTEMNTNQEGIIDLSSCHISLLDKHTNNDVTTDTQLQAKIAKMLNITLEKILAHIKDE
ncbi:sulfatase-like hydrolase/transferase [Plesiomonas shigelloides]|uniref:sulfatase-like hydrolase/transferase n=1 Tax=Plesiomonas shigelloides TaxID=703 RepID=UPI002700F0CE|nr:sulfatase-like hydrolase/transferase [Plesiomonas sp.]